MLPWRRLPAVEEEKGSVRFARKRHRPRAKAPRAVPPDNRVGHVGRGGVGDHRRTLSPLTSPARTPVKLAGLPQDTVVPSETSWPLLDPAAESCEVPTPALAILNVTSPVVTLPVGPVTAAMLVTTPPA